MGDIYLLTPDVGDSYAEGLDWSSPIELFPGRPSTISDQSAWPVLRYSNKLLGLFSIVVETVGLLEWLSPRMAPTDRVRLMWMLVAFPR